MVSLVLGTQLLPTLLPGCDRGDPVGGAIVAGEGNTGPTTPAIRAWAVAEGQRDETLLCEVTTPSEDPDGDAIAYSYEWTVDGRRGPDGSILGPEDAVRGSEWICTVTATDGVHHSGSVSASLSVTEPVPGQYAWEIVQPLTMPADVVALDDGRLLIADMLGQLSVINPVTDEVEDQLALFDHPDDLISIELHPEFGDGEHDLLFAWGNTSGNLYVYDFALDPLSATNEREVLNVPQYEGGTGHCGGDLLWWEGEADEPVLYLSTGPGLRSEPQDETMLAQKVLALQWDGTTVHSALDTGYADRRVAAIGLRNPWRLTDCGAVMCIAEPGGTRYEEIDLYSHAGSNFGFPYVEGPGDGTYDESAVYWARYDTSGIDDDLDGPGVLGFVRAPVVGPRLSDKGYGGRLAGYVPYADIYDAWIRGMKLDDDGIPTGDDVPLASLQYLLAMDEAADGTLYAVEMGGSLRRLVYRDDVPRLGDPGLLLSAGSWTSGTVYHPRYASWENGATAERTLSIPEGETIRTVTYPWTFPVGTVISKTLSVGGVPVETQVLRKEDGGWVPGVFVWDGDDAALTDGTRQELTLADGTRWVVGATNACGNCHNDARRGEWPIGLERFVLGDEGLADVAPMLDSEPSAAPSVEGSELDQIVRPWMHVNCGYCHNMLDGVAGKVSVVQMDLTYTATDMGLDGVAQYFEGNPNVDSGALYVDPGSPWDSVLVRLVGEGWMPPLGVFEPDADGATEIARWVAEQAPTE